MAPSRCSLEGTHTLEAPLHCRWDLAKPLRQTFSYCQSPGAPTPCKDVTHVITVPFPEQAPLPTQPPLLFRYIVDI